MPFDLRGLLAQLRDEGVLAALASNPRVQFGRTNRQYLGATLLPERLQPQNEFREEGIRFRSPIANANTRYSPVELKEGQLVSSFLVELAESAIGSEFTARAYDTLIQMLARNATMDSMTSVINWVDLALVTPLVEWNERARWQAIIDAKVLLRGGNKYAEDIDYVDPTDHRVAAQDWTDPNVDPFEDLFAQQALLATKGYVVARQIASQRVIGILGANPNVAKRAGAVRVVASGANATVTSVGGSTVTRAQINAVLAENGLPPIEPYDLQYQTNAGTGRFMPDDVFVQIGATGEETEVQLDPDTIRLLPDTLGYVGVGRAAGQSAPGRVVRTEAFDNKPPRIEGEAWQTSLPVITQPEAISVLTDV